MDAKHYNDNIWIMGQLKIYLTTPFCVKNARGFASYENVQNYTLYDLQFKDIEFQR